MCSYLLTRGKHFPGTCLNVGFINLILNIQIGFKYFGKNFVKTFQVTANTDICEFSSGGAKV